MTGVTYMYAIADTRPLTPDSPATRGSFAYWSSSTDRKPYPVFDFSGRAKLYASREDAAADLAALKAGGHVPEWTQPHVVPVNA